MAAVDLDCEFQDSQTTVFNSMNSAAVEIELGHITKTFSQILSSVTLAIRREGMVLGASRHLVLAEK